MSKRRSIFIAVFYLSLTAVYAQQYTANKSSTISPNGRYEIMQSEIAARWTFRLDRFCGSVSQLVATPTEENAWQITPVESQAKCVFDGKVHYQLFLSGVAAKYSFLMNTDTGTTWTLVTDKDKNNSWQLFSR